MRGVARVLTVVLVSVLAGRTGVQRVDAQGDVWTSNGPDGGSINVLAVDPENPKSTDGGGRWSAMGARVADAPLHAVAIDPATPSTLYASASGVVPRTLYAGTGANSPDICRGVFKSTDGGSNWIELGPRNRAISAVAVDPRTSTTLYASTNQWACGEGGPLDPGIYKSTDGGATWFAINSRLTTALAIDPQAPATIYAGTGDSGVFKSIDGGMTWNDFNAGLANLSVATLLVHRAAVYAGTAGGGLFARSNPPIVPLP